MLMLSADHDTGDMKWDDMKDKDISMKMQFWWDKMKMVECKISKVKTMVRQSMTKNVFKQGLNLQKL